MNGYDARVNTKRGLSSSQARITKQSCGNSRTNTPVAYAGCGECIERRRSFR